MTYYFAQNATIEVREPNSTRYKVVGAVQDVSIDTEFEVEELYQFGSILRATASRHHATINVKVSSAQFGSFGDDAAWFWKILNSAGISSFAESTLTKHSITIEDTSSLPLFTIAGEWRSDDDTITNGKDTIYARVDGVYFKNFSWGGGLGEYIIEELEGTGASITFTDSKTVASGGDDSMLSGAGVRIITYVEAVYTSASPATINITNYAQFKNIVVATSDDDVLTVAHASGVITVTKVAAGFANVYIMADGLSKIIPCEFQA